MIKRIIKFYFTGTDTSKTVVEELSKEISKILKIDNIVDYNYTSPDVRKKIPIFTEEDLVISAMPTIAGRVPNLLLPYLKTIEGNGALAISISLYGNRNVDDCLVEHRDLLKNAGLKIIGGGAFIGEHSFSKTLAKNRPDNKDLTIVKNFAKEIANKIQSNNLEEPEMIGQVPYRPYYTPRDRHGTLINFIKIKPKTNRDLCIDCKICANSCPLGSIDFDEVWKVPGKCMKCCACIKKCPTGAKFFDDEGYIYHKEELEDMYGGERLEPQIFY